MKVDESWKFSYYLAPSLLSGAAERLQVTEPGSNVRNANPSAEEKCVRVNGKLVMQTQPREYEMGKRAEARPTFEGAENEDGSHGTE